jgi:hypothetical protein
VLRGKDSERVMLPSVVREVWERERLRRDLLSVRDSLSDVMAVRLVGVQRGLWLSERCWRLLLSF